MIVTHIEGLYTIKVPGQEPITIDGSEIIEAFRLVYQGPSPWQAALADHALTSRVLFEAVEGEERRGLGRG